MRKFLVTLKQSNNTEVTVVVDAITREEATKKALGTANNIARGEQSKVITSKKPLKEVKVESWEDCSLRVVKGDKQYRVLLVTQQDSLEGMVKGVAGIKSAYAYAVKKSKPQAEVRAYVYDFEQKAPQVKCICCKENYEMKEMKELKTGGYVCEYCLEEGEDYAQCLGCGEIYKTEDMTNTKLYIDPNVIPSDFVGHYCDICLEGKVICCACGQIFDEKEIINSKEVEYFTNEISKRRGNGCICQTCDTQYDLTPCEDCGNLMPNVSAIYYDLVDACCDGYYKRILQEHYEYDEETGRYKKQNW